MVSMISPARYLTLSHCTLAQAVMNMLALLNGTELPCLLHGRKSYQVIAVRLTVI